ncbi:hypothetical protein SARI_03619 [Salmonella enterica subsp. arizonae serovar 62:z4,z23:-]|uniref:Uncharacterized protein n=1 Tax=Salmonella arizonae (strain ATCC BAA-731 / CDC346-86 / RSK2980) TaxID=41514 RepID=A9MI84_SALAR|nr:hypothetical protein SARI_03619 [Salmonella enterica subsp. arizonae serovar 62:z4,z23:-]
MFKPSLILSFLRSMGSIKSQKKTSESKIFFQEKCVIFYIYHLIFDNAFNEKYLYWSKKL